MPEYDLTRLSGSFDRVSRYFNIIRPLLIGPYRRAAAYVLGKLESTGGAPAVLDIGTARPPV